MKSKENDVESQIHAVKDELSKLGKEFSKFNERLRKLEAHIKQAHEDVADVRKSSEKIAARFTKIKKV